MSDQQHTPSPAGEPDRQPLAPRPVSIGYRRWAAVLLWIALILLAFEVVALVASFVLLGLANASSDAAAYGYLAIFLWVAVAVLLPVLLGTGIPGLVMTRRVRRTPQALGGTAA
ncbi:hypothetical protein [Promicromonospora sukumoe]|uniref:Uncharacterized protein n=1 Tax=Promicromonospora sukumoe TaxID=88382 RepID=A0A7W3JCV2_9MICO|nr:hypothetical protein [Promicromonospora sukumoe]MBA8810512.1 hypothetical protein [Promicromonospora sukumoe]